MVLNITADRERFPALRPGKIQKFGLPYAGNVDAVVEEADGARLRVAFCKPISRAKARLALSGRPVEDALLDEIEQLQAGHSHPKFSTVPEWLLWVVLLVTTLFVLFFVYSLSSLIVGG